jgi:hypothetical protein
MWIMYPHSLQWVAPCNYIERTYTYSRTNNIYRQPKACSTLRAIELRESGDDWPINNVHFLTRYHFSVIYTGRFLV